MEKQATILTVWHPGELIPIPITCWWEVAYLNLIFTASRTSCLAVPSSVLMLFNYCSQTKKMVLYSKKKLQNKYSELRKMEKQATILTLWHPGELIPIPITCWSVEGNNENRCDIGTRGERLLVLHSEELHNLSLALNCMLPATSAWLHCCQLQPWLEVPHAPLGVSFLVPFCHSFPKSLVSSAKPPCIPLHPCSCLLFIGRIWNGEKKDKKGKGKGKGQGTHSSSVGESDPEMSVCGTCGCLTKADSIGCDYCATWVHDSEMCSGLPQQMVDAISECGGDLLHQGLVINGGDSAQMD